MRQQTPDIMADLGQGDGDAVSMAIGPQVMALDISAVRLDGGTQPRAGIDPAVVADYANDMEANGAEFPPVQVVYDGSAYWLWDGFHRLHARKRNGLYTVPAIVRQGTRRDAVLLSVGANATHGFRRTNEDKRRAVMALLEDQEWRQWSDREIARRCAVSNQFVSTLRAGLSVNDGQIETRRVVRNGTEYTMAPAQRTPAPAVASQAGNYLTMTELEQQARAWSEAWEEPYAAVAGLRAELAAGKGDYLDDWRNYVEGEWRKQDLALVLRWIDGDDGTQPAPAPAKPFVEMDGMDKGMDGAATEPEPAQATREERMAAAMEYDRQRKDLQRCAVDSFVAYAEDHGYTGILRWLAYRLHETAQWEDLAHMGRREIWRLIGDSLIGQVMERQDSRTSLDRLRQVVDERFNDAGLNGVLWPE